MLNKFITFLILISFSLANYADGMKAFNQRALGNKGAIVPGDNINKAIDSFEESLTINQNEEKAKNAENEYNRLKKLKYIQSFLKKTFTCTIEGFSKKLIYVNINDVDFTAFIYRSHLKQDRYRIARSKHAIVGQYTKKTYRVGDSLKTSVENIDMINLEVSLLLHHS